jgi:hypothetical protein
MGAPIVARPWDVGIAAVIAVSAILIVLIFNLSPLVIVVILLALCGYIAARSMIDERNNF